MLVVAVHGQHAAGHLVHDVGRGRVEDHIVGKAAGQLAVAFQQLAEACRLLGRGQAAEQKQPDDLLKHEAVVRVGFGGEGVDVDAAVDQAAGDRLHRAVGLFFVADNVGHVGDARQHAGAVGVAQAALDAEAVSLVRVQVGVVGEIFAAEQFQLLRLKRRNVGIVHRSFPFLYQNRGAAKFRMG